MIINKLIVLSKNSKIIILLKHRLSLESPVLKEDIYAPKIPII